MVDGWMDGVALSGLDWIGYITNDEIKARSGARGHSRIGRLVRVVKWRWYITAMTAFDGNDSMKQRREKKTGKWTSCRETTWPGSRS